MIKLSFVGTSEVVYLPVADHRNRSFRSAEEWIEQYIPVDFLHEFDRSDTHHSLMHLGVKEPMPAKPIRIGVLSWPTDAISFASLHLVAGNIEAERIMELTQQQTTNLPLYCFVEMTDEIGGSISPAMFLLPPRPLAQVPGEEQFWLLSFVDSRYFWWESKYRFEVDTEGGPSFASLINEIAANLGTTVTTSSINSAYQSPSNRFDSWYQPSGMLMDAVTRACGLRYAQSLNGTGKAQSFTDARIDELEFLTSSEFLTRRNSGGTFTQTDRVLPGLIYVSFGKYVCGGYETEPYIISVDLDDIRSDLILLTGQYQTTQGVGNYTIIGDLDADIPNDACSLPTNLPELLAYARRAALDWYCWQVFAEDVVLDGIVDPTIHAGIDMIEWTYRADNCSTRITRKPYNDRTLGMYRVSSEAGYLSAWMSPLDYQNEKICPPCVQNVYAYGSGGSGGNSDISPTVKTLDVVTDVCIERASDGQVNIIVQKRNYQVPFGMVDTGPTTCQTNPTGCCNSGGGGGGGGGGPGVLPCCGTTLISNRLVLTFAGASEPSSVNASTECCPCLRSTSWELFFNGQGLYSGPVQNPDGTIGLYPIDCADVTFEGNFLQEGASGIQFTLNENCELGGRCLPPNPDPDPMVDKSYFGGTTLNVLSCDPFYAEATMIFPDSSFGQTSPCCPSNNQPVDQGNCASTLPIQLDFILTE